MTAMTPERLAEHKATIDRNRIPAWGHKRLIDVGTVPIEVAEELLAEVERLQATIAQAKRTCELHRIERETVGPCGLG